jgi:homoserine kinase type II
MSVYTVVEAPELETFLQDYAVGDLVDFEGISAGIENTNYFVNTTQGQFVLTIFEHHTFEELPYFLNIMAFMAEHQIPTAHPVQTLSDGYLKSIQGKPAALVERLKGRGVEHPSLKQCEVMGEQMARFHLAGRDYDQYRANDRDINWMQNTFQRIEDHLSAEEVERIQQELAFQKTQDYQQLPQGVIHADLFCDNALFDGDELTGIIDLYYACNAQFLYDLAVMVNDWCRKSDNRFDETKITAMVNAYQTKRPLTAEEKQVWPAMLRLAALRFWLSRLQDKVMPREGEMTQIKDPDVFKAVLQYHQAHAQPLQ